MMNDPGFPAEKAHRWFAIEWNNAAWSALEGEPLDDLQQQATLHQAHASVAHWKQVGTPVNWVRGLYLLANIEARFGAASSAQRFAQTAMAAAASMDELADWDHAFIADAARSAAGAALAEEQARGNPDAQRCEKLKKEEVRLGQKSQELGAAIADEEDRKFFAEWLAR